MDVTSRRMISRAYYNRQEIGHHQIRSFNRFVEKLQTIVDQQSIIETNIANKEDAEPVYVDLEDIYIEKPTVESDDDSGATLYPQEARLRNLTYSAPLILNMRIVRGGDKMKEQTISQGGIQIGQLPVMVRSDYCNTIGLSAEQLIESGEDPIDPGGYFIINGSERVLISSEDLASNKILTEYKKRSGKQIEVAKTFSERHGYRAMVVVEYDRDNLLQVSIPSISDKIAFVPLARALGLESDETIAHEVSDDPAVIRILMANLDHSNVSTRQEALNLIGEHIASRNTHQLRRANRVINRHLLPHLNNEHTTQDIIRRQKGRYLCRMAEACLELALNKRNPTDKDHYRHKRIKLAGDLMEDLFRSALGQLGRDMKYQLERAHSRARQLSVSTIVRPDVLTNRLETALATGNWVGGRSGVSQLLDRTNYVSALSDIHRLQSPLSRSRPHFDARDLHATQWGRVCPSETPEGPNCGLVQHFAQAMEISTAVPELQMLKQTLRSLGVERR